MSDAEQRAGEELRGGKHLGTQKNHTLRERDKSALKPGGLWFRPRQRMLRRARFLDSIGVRDSATGIAGHGEVRPALLCIGRFTSDGLIGRYGFEGEAGVPGGRSWSQGQKAEGAMQPAAGAPPSSFLSFCPRNFRRNPPLEPEWLRRRSQFQRWQRRSGWRSSSRGFLRLSRSVGGFAGAPHLV